MIPIRWMKSGELPKFWWLMEEEGSMLVLESALYCVKGSDLDFIFLSTVYIIAA